LNAELSNKKSMLKGDDDIGDQVDIALMAGVRQRLGLRPLFNQG
jgi:hypothetical protein